MNTVRKIARIISMLVLGVFMLCFAMFTLIKLFVELALIRRKLKKL